VDMRLQWPSYSWCRSSKVESTRRVEQTCVSIEGQRSRGANQWEASLVFPEASGFARWSSQATGREIEGGGVLTRAWTVLNQNQNQDLNQDSDP